MRALSILLAAILSIPAFARKLTPEERIDIIRGLSAEYATAKVQLPRSKKALSFDAGGTWDKKQWDTAGRQYGPAARVGDLVQLTKVDLDDDRITIEINNGMKSGRKWYDRVEVGMGGRTSPISQGGSNAPGGTNIAVAFPQGVPASVAEIKKALSTILDFEKRSATEQYVDTLPPEIKTAIKDKKAVEGMDREQVLLSLGRPDHKVRESKDGVDTEDWIYGKPPGRIVFVTFDGSKVIKVKETYAGLGGSTADPLPPR